MVNAECGIEERNHRARRELERLNRQDAKSDKVY